MNGEDFSDYNTTPCDSLDGFKQLGHHGHSIMGRLVRHGQVWFVKCYDASLSESDARLQKEYEVMLALNHPSIARAGWIEEIPGLGKGLVMEWINGETLDSFLDHAIPRERAEIADNLIRAVAYMHTQGVLHLDLKPQNIMVYRQGDTTSVKIIDFGMAQMADKVLFTTAGGTKGFSAPEQFEADYTPEPYSDVYSVGRILELIAPGGVYKKLSNLATQNEPAKRPSDGSNLLRIRDKLQRRRKIIRRGALSLLATIALVTGLSTLRHGAVKQDKTYTKLVDTVHIVVTDTVTPIAERQDEEITPNVAEEQPQETVSEHDRLVAKWQKEVERYANRAEAISANESISKEQRRAMIEQLNDSLCDATVAFFRPYIESVGAAVANAHPLSWCSIYEPAFEHDRRRIRVAHNRLND